jgi:hypothetical protein
VRFLVKDVLLGFLLRTGHILFLAPYRGKTPQFRLVLLITAFGDLGPFCKVFRHDMLYEVCRVVDSDGPVLLLPKVICWFIQPFQYIVYFNVVDKVGDNIILYLRPSDMAFVEFAIATASVPGSAHMSAAKILASLAVNVAGLLPPFSVGELSYEFSSSLPPHFIVTCQRIL